MHAEDFDYHFGRVENYIIDTLDELSVNQDEEYTGVFSFFAS